MGLRMGLNLLWGAGDEEKGVELGLGGHSDLRRVVPAD